MIEASMPSNIALIKYMGKNDAALPINSSLSYTLDDLRTKISLLPSTETDKLVTQVTLKPGGENKFLKHFAMLKQEFNISGFYQIHSANNFPSGTGLASSASSYAALTQATYLLSQKQQTTPPLSDNELAQLARRGSGSSIRSFFSPWCIWQDQDVFPTGENWPSLQHKVLLLEKKHKTISSSEEHMRVMSSPNIKNRAHRAEVRLNDLIQALNAQNWHDIYQICKDEFLDMHELFHTSNPSFSYMHLVCHDIIALTDEYSQSGHQIILTMDAGANMHFLFPEHEESTFVELQKQINLDNMWWQK